jgi:hypothetical protein
MSCWNCGDCNCQDGQDHQDMVRRSRTMSAIAPNTTRSERQQMSAGKSSTATITMQRS